MTFNSSTCWLTIIVSHVLLLLTIVEQTGLLAVNGLTRFRTVNGLTNLLTQLTLLAFCLLTLLEHTALKGFYWYKSFTGPLTLDKNRLLAVSWLLQFPDLETCWQTLANGEKSTSLKEKEILAALTYLETSLYNVLRYLNQKFIWLFCAVNVDTIDFASSTFPCSTRFKESL